jgi:hypothetical protein
MLFIVIASRYSAAIAEHFYTALLFLVLQVSANWRKNKAKWLLF